MNNLVKEIARKEHEGGGGGEKEGEERRRYKSIEERKVKREATLTYKEN